MHSPVDDFDTMSPALEAVVVRFRALVRSVGALPRRAYTSASSTRVWWRRRCSDVSTVAR